MLCVHLTVCAVLCQARFVSYEGERVQETGELVDAKVENTKDVCCTKENKDNIAQVKHLSPSGHVVFDLFVGDIFRHCAARIRR